MFSQWKHQKQKKTICSIKNFVYPARIGMLIGEKGRQNQCSSSSTHVTHIAKQPGVHIGISQGKLVDFRMSRFFGPPVDQKFPSLLWQYHGDLPP